ncbi:MAG: heme-binding protein [Anaerolineaceae bacterium]|nr:heme-binding protein [Anaerolineaceae bacterium]
MTETPDYSVIRKENAIELRQYPAYIKAETTIIDKTYRKAIFKGFKILAGYIFGNNIKTEKIAMTTPEQVSQSQKIAMTKPVTISGDGNYTVAFIMPSEYTLETLPIPREGAIRFTKVPPHTMAAIHFSGYFQGARIKNGRQRLSAWLEKEGLETQGDFIVAGYNPPWVPGFLARNEVMIEIKTGGSQAVFVKSHGKHGMTDG